MLTQLITSLRKIYWRHKFVQLSQRITQTPALACRASAPVEIHTLTGAKGVYLYLAAIKSFLRYCSDVAVVVHDDGSLSRRHHQLLREHIRGIRVLRKEEADSRMAVVLKSFPKCQQYRRNCLMGLQLFDYALLADAERIISLDSDTLFLSEPDQIISWIKDPQYDVLYSVEASPWDPSGLIAKNGGLGDLNGGFLCLNRNIVKLSVVEEILGGEAEFTWWTGQCCFNIICKRQGHHGAFALNPVTYQNVRSISEGAVFRHYFGSSGAFKVYYSDLLQMINDLING